MNTSSTVPGASDSKENEMNRSTEPTSGIGGTARAAPVAPVIHEISGKTADELWLETGRLRSELADIKAGGTARAAPADENADWLKGYTAGQSLAHAYYDNRGTARAEPVAPSPALAPCPFCAALATCRPDEIGSGGQHVGPYHAGCRDCRVFFTEEEAGDAIGAWNRRSSDAASAPSPEPTAILSTEKLLAAGYDVREHNGRRRLYHNNGSWISMRCMDELLASGVQPPNQPTAEPIAWGNRDELDNMLDDREATIQGQMSGWRKTPLYLGVGGAAELTNTQIKALWDRVCPHHTGYYDEAIALVRAAISQSAGTLPQTSDVHPVERGGTLSDAAILANPWIAVSERLPPMDHNVLIVEPYGVSVGSRATDDEDSREWLDLLSTDNCGDPNSTCDVTHWMELPPPPMAASDSPD